jgi:hypothetical protein
MKQLCSLMALLFSLNLWAYNAHEVVLPQTEAEGGALIQELMESSFVRTENTFAFTTGEKSAQYPAGDFAILWGIGSSEADTAMAKDEYTRLWRIMGYLSAKGFRVIMNVRADAGDVKEAVETEGTSVVLYSGHGNTSGFYDYNKVRVGYDLFVNKAKSVYQFIVAACYGRESRVNYNPPADLMMFTWSGLTNSTDLENFVMGSWTGMEGKDLAVRE